MNKSESISAIIRLIEHATEVYPHFESPRGVKDITDARMALQQLCDAAPNHDALSELDAVLAKRLPKMKG